MRLVTFAERAGGAGREERIGVVDSAGETLVELPATGPGQPGRMLELIAGGPAALEAARRAAEGGRKRRLADSRLLAPIPRPAKNVFCVGKNYHEHAQEFHASGFDASAGKAAIPDVPIIFTKPATAVIGPGVPIPSGNDPTHSVDYEGELTVVIGKGGRGIARADALAHVFGYTIINDVTARTLQHRHKQWFLGKSIDGFCPMGPWIATADEVPDLASLRLETRVNGELRQNALVRDLIFDVPFLIETISSTVTLEPGDLIATGTPAGVGIGFDPSKYLKPGDRVAITIGPLGTLENPVS
jgi:2-keto-4-pentenoate hydratase/2-oxohepta-3-ene-1,7-dioic acid hydratase in catechol pathway